MTEWILVIALLAVAAGLFIASYFVKDTGEKNQEEFEELSLNLLQDMHAMKKRLELMEQEMDLEVLEEQRTGRVMDITKRHVLTLYTKGTSPEDITEQIKIPEAAVQDIIDEYIAEGL